MSLTVRNRDELLKKIDRAFEREYRGRAFRKKELHAFPLPDILAELYQSAEISEDFHSISHLEKLHEEYVRTENCVIPTVKELAEDGWVAVLFDRWELLQWNERRFKKENLKEYPDQEILKFLFWLKEKEAEALPAVRLAAAEECLDRWRQAAPWTPKIEWFEQKQYLKRIGEEYYARDTGHLWSEEVCEALAKLWQYGTGAEDRKRWLETARAVGGYFGILDFLEEPAELAEFLIDEIFGKYEVPSITEENHRIVRQEWLERPGKENTYEGFRVLNEEYCSDLDLFERCDFEWSHFLWRRRSERSLTVGLVIGCLPLLKEEKFIRAGEVLMKLDRIGIFVDDPIYDPEAVLELCLHEGTQFLGFRSLLNGKGGAEAFKEVLERLLEENQRGPVIFSRDSEGNTVRRQVRESVLEPEAAALLLHWLAEKANLRGIRRKANNCFQCLQYLAETIGREDSLFEAAAPAVCTELEAGKRDTWELACFCMDAWFYRGGREHDAVLFRRLQRIILSGYLEMVQSESGIGLSWLEEETVLPELWKDIYRDLIRKAAVKVRRGFAEPLEVTGEETEEECRKLRDRFRMVLRILSLLLDEYRDELKGSVAVNLEMLFSKGQNGRMLLDHIYIQNYNWKEILRTCMAVVSMEEQVFNVCVERLMEGTVHELLIYYDLLECPGIKDKIRGKIQETSIDDLGSAYSSRNVIDIVIKHRFEHLYPAAEASLKRYISAMKDRKQTERNEFYLKVLHQLNLLYYFSGRYDEILAGDSPFFQALVYMEVPSKQDYERAADIWDEMLAKEGIYTYGSSVYLNDLILLVRMLEAALKGSQGIQIPADSDSAGMNKGGKSCTDAGEPDSGSFGTSEKSGRRSIKDRTTSQEGKRQRTVAELVEKIEKLSEFIESVKLSTWTESEKEDYCTLILEKRRLMGEEILGPFARYVSDYGVSLKLEEVFREKPRPREEPDKQAEDEAQIKNALRSYLAMHWIKRSQMYYEVRSIGSHENSDQLLILDTVLRTCAALVKYGSHFLVFSAKRSGKWPFLPEDRVSVFFREIYNAAFTERFQLHVGDQEKGAFTGNIVSDGTMAGMAEVDLTLYAEGRTKSIVEALVLKDTNDQSGFRDHVGKVLGNNISQYPLSFLLLYGNASDSQKAFRNFREYLTGSMKDDIASAGFELLETGDFKDSPLYEDILFRDLSGMEILYQRIQNAMGKEYQVYYIYMDLAKEAEAALRRVTARKKQETNEPLGGETLH